jgi:AI-2E family transporter
MPVSLRLPLRAVASTPSGTVTFSASASFAVAVVTVWAALVFAGPVAAFDYPLVNGLTHLSHQLPSYAQDAEHGHGEGPKLRRGVLGLMSPERAVRYTRIAGEISQSVTGYMLSDGLTSLIAGIVVFVTLTVLGVPFALLWALWVALVDFLPWSAARWPPGLPMPVARCGLWISWMRCLTAVRSVLPWSQRPAVTPGA